MPRKEITVSFACANSAMAAKMIEYFDRLNAESMDQLCNSLNNHPEDWTEFRPDGSIGTPQPMNAVPPHVAQPNMPVPQTVAAASEAPIPYQQSMPMPQAPQPPAPQAPAPQMPPAPQPTAAPPTPPAVPPQQPAPYNAPPQGMPAAPAPSPQPQQMAMPYTPMPSSAPVITREQLAKALQLFASSAPSHAVSVRELLGRFGVDSLNALPETSIPEFVNSLRGMGCAI